MSRKKKKKLNKAYLFGPFIGELEWEMYRFAPFAIYLKKTQPECKMIVYTRPDRFDLYGKYANILVPLNLKGEDSFCKFNFGLEGFRLKHYDTINKYFYKKYEKRFEVVEHFSPDLEVWRNKIKWQFPRDKMDYNFQPREENKRVIDLFKMSKNVFVESKDSDIRHSLSNKGYNPFMKHWMIVDDNKNESFVGNVIISLKQCEFVVGNMKSWITKLALLLRKPVISINEKMKYDSIHLLNPFDIPVINCENIEEGIDIYENNF